jgi:predicted nucleotidyltransferase
MEHGLKEHTIQKIQSVLGNFPEVEEAVLYGSRAKGNYKNGSDIDLTLKGKNLNLLILGKIDEQLDDLLLPYTFDLSIFHQISNPELLDHMNRAGKLFFSNKTENTFFPKQ